MKAMSCAAARRRLHAFHDGELPIGEQIAMAAHLDLCRACADSLADWLGREGWAVTRVGSRKGYRLLEVTRP